MTIKKIINMTIGEVKFPIKIPNLNHNLFNGVKIFELNNPKIKKVRDMVNSQILILPFLNNVNIDKIKKNIKKTIPKFLLDGIFIFFIFILISKIVVIIYKNKN